MSNPCCTYFKVKWLNYKVYIMLVNSFGVEKFLIKVLNVEAMCCSCFRLTDINVGVLSWLSRLSCVLVTAQCQNFCC